MNKKTLTIVAAVAITALAGTIAYMVLSSRSLSPSETATYSHNGLDIKVTYCRPSKRGRLIFGEADAGAILPHGKYWRLGANEATEITFSRDITISGKHLKAGSYRMYAVPNATSWTISLNSELGKWGADEPNPDLDVLRVEVPVDTLPSETEQFTISFDSDATGIKMHLAWDKTHVSVPIRVQ